MRKDLFVVVIKERGYKNMQQKVAAILVLLYPTINKYLVGVKTLKYLPFKDESNLVTMYLLMTFNMISIKLFHLTNITITNTEPQTNSRLTLRDVFRSNAM